MTHFICHHNVSIVVTYGMSRLGLVLRLRRVLVLGQVQESEKVWLTESRRGAINEVQLGETVIIRLRE